jgi:preprotein translocase subunit SecE
VKFIEWLKRFPAFVKDVRLELKKTSFPSGLEVRNTTMVVVVVVIIFGIYLWVVDTVVFAILKEVFRSFER